MASAAAPVAAGTDLLVDELREAHDAVEGATVVAKQLIQTHAAGAPRVEPMWDQSAEVCLRPCCTPGGRQ